MNFKFLDFFRWRMFYWNLFGKPKMPCSSIRILREQQGAVQVTMQELASKGLSSKILPPPVTRTDFEKILAGKRPTVSKADCEAHERFTKEFGVEG
ncbi:Vacuolar protein sorting-associated protein 4B [Stylosanthes scabra]|uniref:Vacuolar protein sorting-associated protein 4B n=1 Tax=Stylosanthes scabra TaxID=79078 RepID=A0ABU6Y5X7_9FABA|nr:Vacuolar protein sorting-associated protein 4B [Stylosanthes scabra]